MRDGSGWLPAAARHRGTCQPDLLSREVCCLGMPGSKMLQRDCWSVSNLLNIILRSFFLTEQWENLESIHSDCKALGAYEMFSILRLKGECWCCMPATGCGADARNRVYFLWLWKLFKNEHLLRIKIILWHMKHKKVITSSHHSFIRGSHAWPTWETSTRKCLDKYQESNGFVYLDFSEEFDTVSEKIPTDNLLMYGLDEKTAR